MNNCHKMQAALIFFLFFSALNVLSAQDETRGRYEYFINRYEELLEEEGTFSDFQIDVINGLVEDLERTNYEDLLLRARTIQVLFLENRRTADRSGHDTPPPEDPLLDPFYSSPGGSASLVGGGLTLGTGLASLALFNVFSYLGNAAFDSYNGADASQDTSLLYNRWMLYETLSYVFLGTGVLGVSVSIPLFVVPTNRPPRIEPITDERRAMASARRMNKKVEGLKGRTDHVYQNARAMDAAMRVSLGVGLTSLVGTGLSLLLSETTYESYKQASYPQDADLLHRDMETLQTLSIGFGIGSAAGLLSGVFFSLLRPEPLSLHRGIAVTHTSLRQNPVVEFDEELYNRYVEHQIELLEHEKTVLTRKLAQAKAANTGYTATLWTTVGLGAASLAGMGVCLYFSDLNFDKYNAAASPEEAEQLKTDYERMRTLSVVAGISGGTLLSSAGITALLKPSPVEIRRELAEVERQLDLFKTRLR